MKDNHPTVNGSGAAPHVHFTELPRAEPNDPLFHEWNAYLDEVKRLLDEGQGGTFALIHGDKIDGLFDTEESARAEGLRRYLLTPFLVQQIRSREPILRLRGYNLPWPNSPSPLAKPA